MDRWSEECWNERQRTPAFRQRCIGVIINANDSNQAGLPRFSSSASDQLNRHGLSSPLLHLNFVLGLLDGKFPSSW